MSSESVSNYRLISVSLMRPKQEREECFGMTFAEEPLNSSTGGVNNSVERTQRQRRLQDTIHTNEYAISHIVVRLLFNTPPLRTHRPPTQTSPLLFASRNRCGRPPNVPPGPRPTEMKEEEALLVDI